jgi:hypothetical protein
MKQSTSFHHLARKNKRINAKQLRDAIDVLEELRRLGMHQGPNYRLGIPYADSLREADTSLGEFGRKLRFECP